MYETRVLTFGVNTSPGTFPSFVDQAICVGFIPKGHVIVNKEMIEVAAKHMEALGVSNCQKHYIFMNGDTHSEHAISISGALMMVEKWVKDKPDDHMDIIEKLRAERRADASNLHIFSNKVIPSSSNSETNTHPFDVLPSPLLFPMVESFLFFVTATRLVPNRPTGSLGNNFVGPTDQPMHAPGSLAEENVLTH
jgi:hypothetical protein